MELETKRLILREFTKDDDRELTFFRDDPSQLKYMMFSLGSDSEISDFLKMAVSQSLLKEKRSQFHLAVLEKKTGKFAGSSALMIEEESPTSAELGYWFRKDAWGKGFATEASLSMIRTGFETLGLHRIWGKCQVENSGSARVMEKCGMQFEGILREHVWLRDHYRSSRLYSILQKEHDPSRACPE